MSLHANHKPAAKNRRIRKLIDHAIVAIRRTERASREGPYGKQSLLQSIYTGYLPLRDSKPSGAVRRKLERRLGQEAPDGHVLGLLIRVALPSIKRNVVDMWIAAIRFGERRHVRPHMFRSFLFANGGLVRCAILFRKEEAARLAEEESARQQADDLAAQRRSRRRRRQSRSSPTGWNTLF
jgi:hypothetical protein